jgi:hypothetical protein
MLGRLDIPQLQGNLAGTFDSISDKVAKAVTMLLCLHSWLLAECRQRAG